MADPVHEHRQPVPVALLTMLEEPRDVVLRRAAGSKSKYSDVVAAASMCLGFAKRFVATGGVQAGGHLHRLLEGVRLAAREGPCPVVEPVHAAVRREPNGDVLRFGPYPPRPAHVEQEAIGAVLSRPAVLAELGYGVEVLEGDVGPAADVFDVDQHVQCLAFL